jgi:hypothetical protein
MGSIDTIQVLWRKKFGQEPVTINEADFDPEIHKRVDEEGAVTEAKEPKGKGKAR